MSAVAADERLLHHRPFLLFFTARMASRFAVQIATVALGWQVYALTNSAFALGMIGLAQFLPTAILVFFAGAAADRYERRRLLQICQIVQGCAAAFLAFGDLRRLADGRPCSTARLRSSASPPPSRRRRAPRCCRRSRRPARCSGRRR